MPKASPILTAFSSGEFSPNLDGRVDLEDYRYACKRLENFIPTLQGPAVRRAGTRFVAEAKSGAGQVWFGRFEFSVDQAYILEFGNNYIRFYTELGQLLSGGVPYEIVSPYGSADLVDADGYFTLNYVQSGDVIYFTHKAETFPIYKLSRLAATNWTMTEVFPQGGPFEDIEPDQTITVYASAATGAGITLTASSALFTTDDVGSYFLLENKLVQTATQWEPGKSITTNDIRKSDGKWYQALNTATTGTVTPTHTEGAVYDGDTGVQWQFQHAGFGWVGITAFVSTTVVQAQVLSRLPDDVVGASNATTRWAFQSFSTRNGYPSLVTFFKERLAFFKSSNKRAYFSVTSDFENFARRNTSGEVVDDRAIIIDITGGKVNRFEWVVSGDDLLLGTAGGEQLIRELTKDRPFAPGNVTSVQISEYGSSPCPPVRVGNSILFVQKSGRRIRELGFRPTGSSIDGYASIDVTVNAEHLFPRGSFIKQIKYQQEPYSVVWIIRNDGEVFGCRFNPNTQLIGFFRSPIGGGSQTQGINTSADVKCMEVIPSPSLDRDDVWFHSVRSIKSGMSTVNSLQIEYMERVHDETQDVVTQFYVDGGLSYSGVATTSITGLGHLEGLWVDILADGATHPQKQVSSGAITLDREASDVNVGIPCPAKLQTMRIESGAADGTAQGKIARIHRLSIRFDLTLGGKIGPSEDKLDTILFRKTTDPMDAPPPTFTGDKVNLSFPGDYDYNKFVWYVNDQPLPATVVAIMPKLHTQDR